MPQPPDPSHGRTLDVADPHKLRALAHPLRLQLLRLVREHRPVTGARLADLVGESSASVSYHLSILARHGFVERDPAPGPTRRHKLWRTTYDSMRIVAEGGDGPPGETVEGAILGPLLAQVRAEQDGYVDGSSGLDPRWQELGTFDLTQLALTAEELDALSADIEAVFARYRGADAAAALAPDQARFSVSFIAVPTRAGGTSS